jgi:hypothetical protein
VCRTNEGRRAEPKHLSDIIGYENDLAEFAMTTYDEELFAPETRETPDGILTAKRSKFHRQARPVDERLFSQGPVGRSDRWLRKCEEKAPCFSAEMNPTTGMLNTSFIIPDSVIYDKHIRRKLELDWGLRQ